MTSIAFLDSHDITVWEDKLVWSCRMEGLTNFGDWVRAVPTNDVRWSLHNARATW